MKATITLFLIILISCTPKPIVEQNDAVLEKATGTVTVNEKAAAANTRLTAGDVVRTEDGEATIEFYNGAVTRLNKNTEVTIESISKQNIRICFIKPKHSTSTTSV